MPQTPNAAPTKRQAHESQTPENRLVEAINLEILCRENLRLDLANTEGLGAQGAPLAQQAKPSPGPGKTLVPALAPHEMVKVSSLSKTFTLHLSGPAVLTALEGVSLSVGKGKCLGIAGPSGAGKSSLLRLIYGNYLITEGEIYIRDGSEIVALSQASPRRILALRQRAISYVSQFLRVIPRVSALGVVAEPLLARGVPSDEARGMAAAILGRLRVPSRLQNLPPATFSGGERQRVNIARGLVWPSPILLLDEPTASLDPANKNVALDLILEAKDRGAAIIGVFHDREAMAAVSDDIYQARANKDNGQRRTKR